MAHHGSPGCKRRGIFARWWRRTLSGATAKDSGAPRCAWAHLALLPCAESHCLNQRTRADAL
eukprot:14111738-Alexandrium_andersonii.AAC.1